MRPARTIAALLSQPKALSTLVRLANVSIQRAPATARCWTSRCSRSGWRSACGMDYLRIDPLKVDVGGWPMPWANLRRERHRMPAVR